MQTRHSSWERFKRYHFSYSALELALDISRMNFDESFPHSMEGSLQKAFAAMRDLERGAIANPDENRMVGHYWLRAPERAPSKEITREIRETVQSVQDFAQAVHRGEIKGEAGPFRNLLLIGIGGSALGPQFVSQALGHPQRDRLKFFSLDNTDPEGFERVFSRLSSEAGVTLCLVISKSGGTKETRNGMIEAKSFFQQNGFEFARHAVAVTGPGSELDKTAKMEGWLACFPMWDWVGGRTSETSAVGLLPAALQGFEILEILKGAKACDEQTREENFLDNPAAQLAVMWYYAGEGRGKKDMVILPYKDSLELFSRYLQQLVMESLGKEIDLSGNQVHQGISVFGNKGSTDQHAYVQQLREGVHNFFVTFIEVLTDKEGDSQFVEPEITSGDYLHGFYLGTRQALFEKARESITITVRNVSPFSIGVLIALFERAVGLYALLININAYHQPGVEAGKNAAGQVLALKSRLLERMRREPGKEFGVEELASALEETDKQEIIYKLLEHLSSNPQRRVIRSDGIKPEEARYRASR
jgi:glucose-6-phosphate isomerase